MKRTAALLSVCLGLLSAMGAARAATFTWTGNGSSGNLNLWLASQNWSGGGVPGAGDIASFGDVAVGKSSTPTVNSGQTAPILGINFNGVTTLYNVSGAGTLNIGADGITNSSGHSQTFSIATVGLTADQTFNNTTASSSLNFTGTTLDLASHTLTVDGSGITTIANTITGTGGNLIKSGLGTLNLNSVESYTGTTTINAGRLSFGVAQNLGDVVLNGGTLAQNNTGSSTFGILTINGNPTIDLASSGSLRFASATYTSGLLTINNWGGPADTGVPNPGGAPAGIFITAQPDSSFLANVQFIGNGSNGTFEQGAAWISNTGELVPIPEPQVYAAIFALGLLGFAIARRRMLASA